MANPGGEDPDKPDFGHTWAQEYVRRVGAALKAARGDKSAKWLSDRTANLGLRISPTVIAKLDSGHRASLLTVPELLVLAAALEIPPVAALFPDLPDGEVAVLPKISMKSESAMLWFSGESLSLPFDLLAGGARQGSTRPANDTSELIEVVRQRREAVRQLLRAPRDEVFRQEVEELKAKVRQLNARIHGLGGVVDDERPVDGGVININGDDDA